MPHLCQGDPDVVLVMPHDSGAEGKAEAAVARPPPQPVQGVCVAARSAVCAQDVPQLVCKERRHRYGQFSK